MSHFLTITAQIRRPIALLKADLPNKKRSRTFEDDVSLLKADLPNKNGVAPLKVQLRFAFIAPRLHRLVLLLVAEMLLFVHQAVLLEESLKLLFALASIPAAQELATLVGD